jgi:replicative DNA helicase
MFIYRDEYYYNRDEWEREHPEKDYPEGIADIIIAKHRNGPTGQVSLRFVSKLAKFENIGSQEPSLL